MHSYNISLYPEIKAVYRRISRVRRTRNREERVYEGEGNIFKDNAFCLGKTHSVAHYYCRVNNMVRDTGFDRDGCAA